MELHISDSNIEYIQIYVEQNYQKLPIKCKYLIDDEKIFDMNLIFRINRKKEYNIYYKDKLLYNIKLIKYFGTINYTFQKYITCDKQIYLGLCDLTNKINILDDIKCIYEKQDDKYKEIIKKTNLYGDECFNISNIGIYKFLIDNKNFKIVKTILDQEIKFINSRDDYLIAKFLD